jgi:hypothetical protein
MMPEGNATNWCVITPAKLTKPVPPSPPIVVPNTMPFAWGAWPVSVATVVPAASLNE